MLQDIDTLIVGAGFAGAVSARLLAERGEKVLVVDKRNHIGGNCFDKIDFATGALIHMYGPHLFHTDNPEVWDFVSHFADMEVYEHRVKANIDGKLASLPFNLETLYEVFPNTLAMEMEIMLTESFGYGENVTILDLKKQKEPQLEFLANYIYDKVFVNYTMKQWGLGPEDIDKEVTARVPVRINRDSRYFTDRYQGVPIYGYTKLFENILDHDNIHILLNTPASDVLEIKSNKTYIFGKEFKGKVIYTGGIDALFNYEYKPLPYRSVFMEFEVFGKDRYQEAATVNYPNNFDFTRITEFKHIHKTFGKKDVTIILKEYPIAYEANKTEPYYPMFTKEAKAAYKKYEAKAKKVKNLILLGRLAEYKYYDMDDIIARAMEKVSSL
ncbi:MAG: UDP-galactopyranose mutase [Selenomonadaceae bacterium]|nr:UDP-galactopyranose mutase [Selenomonadaceae bacterium]